MHRNPQPNRQVRLKVETHAKLKALASKAGVEMTDVLETLVNLASDAGTLDSVLFLAKQMRGCPGDEGFRQELVCNKCGLKAGYHKSAEYRTRFVDGVTKVIKGS